MSSGDHSFVARLDGKYIYCFSNEHWSATSKEVSFNVHGIVYVPEAEAPSDPLEVEGQWFRSREGWLLQAKLGSLVRQLSELLSQVKDEQTYIVLRERTHRNTAESTNGRVKWWSIFQLGVLIAEGIFQVWWLKRFFEVCDASSSRFREWRLTQLLLIRSSVLSERWSALRDLPMYDGCSRQCRRLSCCLIFLWRCIARKLMLLDSWGFASTHFANCASRIPCIE